VAIARTSVGSMVSGIAAISVTYGAGAAVGNSALLIVETANETVPAVTGFNVLATSTGTGTAGTAGATRLTILYSASISSTAAVSVGDSGDHQNAVLITFSGTHQTTPFIAGTDFVVTPAQTAGQAAGGQNVAVNDFLLAIIGTDRDNATASALTGSNWVNVSGTDTTVLNSSSTTGAGGGLIIQQLVATSTGTSPAWGATITSSIYTSNMIQVKPFIPTSFPPYDMLRSYRTHLAR
jgi:hypothetical protein